MAERPLPLLMLSIGVEDQLTSDVREEITRYLTDPGSFEDPYPLFAAARSLGPVIESNTGAWVAIGFDAVESILRDDTFSRAETAAVECEAIAGETVQGKEAADVFRGWFFNMDPPEHTRLRRLAAPAFRPRVVAEFGDRVDDVADRLIDELIGIGEADFLSVFAYQLPHLVICEMLGVPAEDHQRWGNWLHEIMEGNRTSLDSGVDPLREALLGFGAYCRELLQARYNDPGEDLLGSLIQARDSSDIGMTEEELVSTLTLLVVAGHETTVHLLGNGLYSMLRHEDQWRELQRSPGLAGKAVEESLRYEPSARIRPRKARASATLEGVALPAGAVVQPVAAAGNRDPKRFDDPDVFDIVRDRKPHLTFGFGAHFCLGAPVARREAVSAFERLAQRVDIELAGDVRWRHAAHRSLEALDVVVRPR